MEDTGPEEEGMKTHYVRVMRPVFLRALIQVEANSTEEACELALKRAAALKAEQWNELGEDRDPPLIIEAVNSAGDEELAGVADPAALLLRCDHAYALLSGDLERVAGDVILTPAMGEVDHMQFADIASDWIIQLDLMRDEHAEESLIDQKARAGNHSSLPSLLEALRKSRPFEPRDDDEDEDD